MSIRIYQHPFASFAQKALVAAYELGVEFEPVLVESVEDREELARLWAPGTMPVLVDTDRDEVIPESSPVIEYLDGLVPGGPVLVPPGRTGLDVRIWDRFMDGSVQVPMQRFVFDELRPADAKDPFGVDEARTKLDLAYAALDARLDGRTWLAGEFSMADCGAGPALFYARVSHRWDEQELANLTAYYRRLTERPSFRRVLDEAMPYRDLFPLPWPEWTDQI